MFVVANELFLKELPFLILWTVDTVLGVIIVKVQGESKKSGISKSMYIALRAIKIKQIKF